MAWQVCDTPGCRIAIAMRWGPKGQEGGTYALVFPLEFIGEVVYETVVEVLTTQVSVTGSGLDLEDALLDGQEGDIKGTTTQVEDENVTLALGLLVKTVGNGSGGGLVDDTEDVETGDETGVLGSLTLGVVEVSRDSDDGVVDGATEVGLCGFPHLGEVLHVGLNLSIGKLAADEALCVEYCVGGVHGDLVLRRVSDETLGVGESNERGGCAVTLVIGDNLNAVVSEDTDARVRGTQVDTDRGA
ncbi:hypothetical protein HBI73_235940 [Parastagonospora nodorum]|nr:hypothetical protein HBI73_235940 [Parastagonospora nodorum]